MNLISGAQIASKIFTDLSVRVASLSFQPLLVDVLVGSDPVSSSYVNIKKKRAEEIGIRFELIQLPEDATTPEVIDTITKAQKDPHLAGLIVQLPLPVGLDRQAILAAIEPKIDSDSLNGGIFPAPTAAAVLEVLKSISVNLAESKVLIVGRGELVGKPVKTLLAPLVQKLDTVDEATGADLKLLAPNADIIISATGVPNLITADLIKTDAIVIDCGTSESSGSIVGDVDVDSVGVKAKWLAPVPGGVGPVTVAKLLENVVRAAENIK